MTDHTARDRRLAAGRARRARLGLDELPERPSRPGRPVTPGGTQPQGRYSEAQIDDEANIGEKQRNGEHAVDLQQALRMHYGYSFTVRENILEKQSNNLRALRVACLSARDPVAAARMVNLWLGAELTAGTARGKQMYFGEDEFLTNNYLSWTAKGHLRTLANLESVPRGTSDLKPYDHEIAQAIANLRTWLGRLQALLALLAVPGRIRNLQGRVTYEGPCVFAAGLRSIARREGNNARTPVASALLGGGQYVGDPGPLASAIGELADNVRSGADLAMLPYLWDGERGSIGFRGALELVRSRLAGTRTAMHFQVRLWADGQKFSCLLGKKGASSTAEVRGVLVRGPEISDAVVITPHIDDERTVGESDAWIEGETLTATAVRGQEVSLKFPKEVPRLMVEFGPTKEPEWTING